jgi:hypothetical protein
MSDEDSLFYPQAHRMRFNSNMSDYFVTTTDGSEADERFLSFKNTIGRNQCDEE